MAARDPYSFGLDGQRVAPPMPPKAPPPTVEEWNRLNSGPAPGSSYPVYPVYTPPAPVGSPSVVAPPAFTGSPLNTLYGIDSESYLTDDQRKLARQIQGKFDASMNRRDRELARYGAPRLASFVEDEALARAMALARQLNIPTQDSLGMVQGSGPGSRGGAGSGGGGGGAGRVPTGSALRNPNAPRPVPPPPGASPSQAAKWQQIMGGLSSILPLLIGKGGMDQLMKDGILGWAKKKYDETFGPGASAYAGDQSFEGLVGGGFPGATGPDGTIVYSPITGMPMYGGAPVGGGYPDVYGPGSGWGEDLIPPVIEAPQWGDQYDPYGAGVDWTGYWDDPTGYWYPDMGGWDFSGFDPYGISGW